MVCTKLKRIDYSKPVATIRTGLDNVRTAYLRTGVIVGFIWWLMWIPVGVALGVDAILNPKSLIVSLVVGVVGMLGSIWLYWLALTSKTESSQKWRSNLSGQSIASAYRALDEIEAAQIH